MGNPTAAGEHPTGEGGWRVDFGIASVHAGRKGARLKQLIERLIEEILFLFARLLPSNYVLWKLRRIARATTKHTFLQFYIDRLVNVLHRRFVSEELKKSGVVIISEGHDRRYQMFEYVYDHFVNGPIDYLEFGVYQGESISWWRSKLGPDSNLYGFDSFEGLPEDWNWRDRKGEFNCHGEIPHMTAPNQKFIKGLFKHSIKPFLVSVKLKPKLILHMDADLYGSTLCVLRAMKDVISPSSILIFDEYWDLKHEFRAVHDFAEETGKIFEYIVASEVRAAIRFTA